MSMHYGWLKVTSQGSVKGYVWAGDVIAVFSGGGLTELHLAGGSVVQVDEGADEIISQLDEIQARDEREDEERGR